MSVKRRVKALEHKHSLSDFHVLILEQGQDKQQAIKEYCDKHNLDADKSKIVVIDHEIAKTL